MAVITGVVKNVAGNLTNGFIEVRTKKERGTTGTFIDSRRHRIKVTDGALIDAPDILEGPVRITVNSSDQGGSGSGFDEFDAVIPDAATVDLWDLKEQTYTYEPPVVSQVQAAKTAAESAQAAAEEAQAAAEAAAVTVSSKIFYDTDGVPYFDPNAPEAGVSLAADTDGVPYLIGA